MAASISYSGGPLKVSASVKAYFSPKLAGMPLDGEPMQLLRQRILALGGIQAANSYVKVNLSLFDLYPREFCPSIPPEVNAPALRFALSDVCVDARHRGFARHRAHRQSAASRP